MLKKTICLVLVLSMIATILAGCGENSSDFSSESDAQTSSATSEIYESELDADLDLPRLPRLTAQQMNSVAMLNYLALVSQKIESAKNNRIYLEEVYSSLLNNTNPVIDEKTQDHLQTMLNIIKDYRQLELKRERLQYIYEQDKANAIHSAIPNPVSVLSVVQSFNWVKLAASVLYTAANSYTNYQSANDALDKQFMMDGWELDDEETETIHRNRTRTFNYMVDMVRDYNIPGTLTLNEESVLNFVEAISNTNNSQKLQFLKSHKEIYYAFGSFWLEMAKCYYALGGYQNCLICLTNYEATEGGIFRYDFQYSEFLPMAIVAAQVVYADNAERYVSEIERFTDALNSPYQTKWELKYFAAQSYLDLYMKTKNNDYLTKAYEIAKDNVNSLVKKQEEQNKTYLEDLKELTLSESDTKLLSEDELKAQNKELKKLNKSLKEKRETELPELYEPLVVNCELLFALADKLQIDDKEKNRINGILSDAFIVDPVAEKYSFGKKFDCSVEFDEDELVVPANILTSSAMITAVIDTDGETQITDFVIDEVDRTSKTISSFMAHYESKTLKSHDWKVGEKITFTISNGENYRDLSFTFEVKEIKSGFWDVVKGVFGSDKVIFECVG